MANRILRDWTDSETIDLLSFQAEVLFIRLFMKADDYGCFHANPKLIKAALFPLKNTRETEVTAWLTECYNAGLIAFYTANEKKYLVIRNFGQRLRTMNRKFPEPPPEKNPEKPVDSNPPPPVDNPPPETKRNEEETETRNRIELEGKILEIKNSRIWIEQTAMHFKKSTSDVVILLNTFLDELNLKDDLSKSIKEIKNHFINALKNNSINAKPDSYNNRKAGLDGLTQLTDAVLQQPFTLVNNNPSNR